MQAFNWNSLHRPQVIILPLFIGIPIGFIFLPISRKRAKVRWRHIGRVTAYSLFVPVVTAFIVAGLVVLALFAPAVEAVGLTLSTILANVVLWVALLAWWAIAIRQYLKMPRGWLIAPLLAVVTTLVVVWLLLMTGSRLVLD